MNSPDEMIDDWKKHIKKAKRQNELEIIKMDLEAEKDIQDLRDEVIETNNKIEKLIYKMDSFKELAEKILSRNAPTIEEIDALAGGKLIK